MAATTVPPISIRYCKLIFIISNTHVIRQKCKMLHFIGHYKLIFHGNPSTCEKDLQWKLIKFSSKDRFEDHGRFGQWTKKF